MELHHQLRIKVDNQEGLTALGLILAAAVIALLGTVALKSVGGKERSGEVAVSVRTGDRLDETENREVQFPARRLAERP